MTPSPISAVPLRLGRRIFGSRLLETIVSPNGFDGYGELLDPTFSMRDVRAEVVAVRRQTPRSVTLTLVPNSNWQGFTAGQHTGLIVEVDGVLTTRFYSPASAATDQGQIELTISRHDGGLLSEHLIEHAKPGMIVGLTPAEGEFTLPAKAPVAETTQGLLLIAGGSGITPVMSILRTLLAEGHSGSITVIRIARTPADALYEAELATITAEHENVEVITAYTRKKVAGALQGHLTKTKLTRACKDFATRMTFVCGPPELTAAAEKIWAGQGVQMKLHTETFKLPEISVAAEDATGTLVFASSGVETANDGRPLLEQAEAAGLSPRCGCRMGICHTCIAHVEEGVVRDLRSGELRTLKDEYVQTCVHAPVGELSIDL